MASNRRGRASSQSSPAAIHVLSQKLNAQRISMQGAKMSPTPVPRAFVQIPWNSWTHEVSYTTTSDTGGLVKTVTFSSIADDLKDQLGIAASSSLRLKVQSAQIWCTAASLVYPGLIADFFEINGNSANAASVRSTQSDKGTLNMPAKAGYVFPLSDSKDVLNAGDNTLAIARGTADKEGSILTIRVHVLWQSRKSS